MNDRIVTQRMGETIGRALDVVPPRVLDRLGGIPGVFEGDIRFSGLRPDQAELNPTWAYCHWTKRDTWISLPWVNRKSGFPSAGVVLHELGHALHWDLYLKRVSLRRWRQRVFWSPIDRDVRVVYGHTGAIPGIRWSLPIAGDPLQEAFADAFRIWCSTPEMLREYEHRPALDVAQFYKRTNAITDWGHRLDNRHLLALFNEMAGYPLDLPPRALRLP